MPDQMNVSPPPIHSFSGHLHHTEKASQLQSTEYPIWSILYLRGRSSIQWLFPKLQHGWWNSLTWTSHHTLVTTLSGKGRMKNVLNG